MSINFLAESKDIFSDLQNIRRHIHRNPELSFKEYKTNEYIREQLTAMGINNESIATTGVIAHIGKGDACVALRADIDALPLDEETGLDYASQTPGVMHACGHDTHTTMLLGAARILKKYEHELTGTVKLLFQPGEEKTPGGASIMIAEGALQNPKPSMIFGQHINPGAPAGTLSFVAGAMMASADELYWTIKGKGAHAAQPHEGKDPLLCAAGLILHLQNLITKNRNPLSPGVLTVTSMHGGTATNIIPDSVELKGTLRSFSEEWRNFAWDYLEQQTKAYCDLHGCEGTITILKGYPPLMNDANAVDFARNIAEQLVGTDTVEDFEPKMWAEDFSFYSHTIPACFWMLGGRPDNMDSMPGLHNPKFAPEESAMIHGTAMLARTAFEALRT